MAPRGSDELRRTWLALFVGVVTWAVTAPANSQEPWQNAAAASVFASSDGSLASAPRMLPAFGGLSLHAPTAAPPSSLDPAVAGVESLDPNLARARAWHAAFGPLGDIAAVLSTKPKIVVIQTTPDEHSYGARVTLQCDPPRCGALVLARF